MKVKIFRVLNEELEYYEHDLQALENQINEFIKDKEVVDIKWSTNITSDTRYYKSAYQALVMYNERNSHNQNLSESYSGTNYTYSKTTTHIPNGEYNVTITNDINC